MRVGLLTGGGDCPGMNAAIRAVVRKGERHYGDELVGFMDGWRGVLERMSMPLDVERCRGLLPRGGTILGTSTTDPYKIDGGPALAVEALRSERIDALVVIGGGDTLAVAEKLSGEGISVVGVPATIENDIPGTEAAIGFETAVQIATDAVDRLHTTAESRDRIMILEVIGSQAGWVATRAGIAGGAAEILVPEELFNIRAIAERLRRRHDSGRHASIVVVAEGASPEPGTMVTQDHGGLDEFGRVPAARIATIAAEIGEQTGIETNFIVLGRVQCSGTPTAFDRTLATHYGIAAIDAVHDGASGQMLALEADHIVRVPLADAVHGTKQVDSLLFYGVAQAFFG